MSAEAAIQGEQENHGNLRNHRKVYRGMDSKCLVIIARMVAATSLTSALPTVFWFVSQFRKPISSISSTGKFAVYFLREPPLVLLHCRKVEPREPVNRHTVNLESHCNFGENNAQICSASR